MKTTTKAYVILLNNGDGSKSFAPGPIGVWTSRSYTDAQEMMGRLREEGLRGRVRKARVDIVVGGV